MFKPLFVSAIAFILTAPALAETGPAMLLMPWSEGQTAHVETSVTTIFDGDVDDSDESISLQRYQTDGRVRFDAGELPITIGFEFDYLNIDTIDSMLPERLVNQAVAVGVTLPCDLDGWTFQLAAGIGYAGSNPFGDGDALYGMADVIATKRIDDLSSFQLFLNYDGNRSIFPDIPLPAAAYNRRVSDTLKFTVGLPFSSVTWMPTDQVTILVRYSVPFTFNARVNYQVIEPVTLFAAFESNFDAYTVDGDPEHRRVFFEQRRIEAGFTWRACETMDLTLAGGYAFDQEFSRGFDARDTDTIRDISDEPYFRAALNFRF